MKALFEAYEFCEQRGMGAYGGGQYELGVGRGHVQLLAALFHPHAPNDIAPGGYDALDPEPGLPESPLDVDPAPTRVPARHRLGRPCRPSPAKSGSSPSPRWLRCSSSRRRSDEELEKETRFKSAAQAILGTRAAERMDAEKAREHFRAAIAAARPQERMQLRRMAEASIALAERAPGRPEGGRRRSSAAPPPTNRQLLMLRVMRRDRAAQERRPAAPDRRSGAPGAARSSRSSASASAS